MKLFIQLILILYTSTAQSESQLHEELSKANQLLLTLTEELQATLHHVQTLEEQVVNSSFSSSSGSSNVCHSKAPRSKSVPLEVRESILI